MKHTHAISSLLGNAALEPACLEDSTTLSTRVIEDDAPESGLDEQCMSEECWNEKLSSLRSAFDPQIYTAYIEPLKFSSYNSVTSELVIAAPSKFHCNHLEKNLSSKINAVLSDKLGIQQLNVKFHVDNSVENSDRRALVKPSSVPHVVVKKLPVRSTNSADAQEKLFQGNSQGSSTSFSFDSKASGLNPKYTFENFVVGSSNEFGCAAALRVAEQPGKSYNPLFIYGGVGLGKTHLLHAIGNAVLAKDPTAKVLYLSSETFTNELIHALRHDKMVEFKKLLRGINVLLIDDIQFISGKERTQEEFFHTFNALYNSKRQIVITSDKIPQDISGLEERLHTRFSWGLTADLQSPDFETRVAILKKKAASDELALPEDVAHLISEKISSNVRELEGALTRLHAVSSLQKSTLDLELAKAALRPLLQAKKVTISIDNIKKAVAMHFNIKVSELTSKRRTQSLAYPRHIAMYLCRKHTSTSFPEIGGQFGGRDHSSVIHSANLITQKIASGDPRSGGNSDDQTKTIVGEIEKRLLGN